MKNGWTILAAACAVVLGVYAITVHSGMMESLTTDAADAYYNLLVRGFRAGQLNLKRDAPPGLAQLADPYDPVANTPYRSTPYGVHDLSYYKGRLYLYFGVTPAVILFWPYAALTGHYLFHRQGVLIFCAIGFLASVGLLRGLWRRYFFEVNIVVVAMCVLALGLATSVPLFLSGADFYQVPISCGYMLTMLALGAIWCAMHEPERRGRWLAAASVAYGLAVGARPSLLFGAVILLVPVAETWRGRRRFWLALLAAVGPIVLIGLGLMLYNYQRFDNPFEFGQRYQLAGEQQLTQRFFSLQYFWFNFRLYFLEPVRWGGRFPFVQGITVPPVPAGHGTVEGPFGVLTNIPLVWLALAVPLVWRGRSVETGILRRFITVVALFFGICALSLCLFRGANARYELEFLPALVWLAVAGILGVESALAPTSKSGQADRPAWRLMARCGWGVLLVFSVAFNLLSAVQHHAEMDNNLGIVMGRAGRMQEAVEHFEDAVRIEPGYAEAHYNLGLALEHAGRLQDAAGHYEQALRLEPNLIEAQVALARLHAGR